MPPFFKFSVQNGNLFAHKQKNVVQVLGVCINPATNVTYVVMDLMENSLCSPKSKLFFLKKNFLFGSDVGLFI